ncbi:MAG: 5'-nucleotidase C-terminal domain-containing protein [Pseudomonadota bacterium]
MTVSERIKTEPGPRPGSGPFLPLRLLFTTDLHAHLFPFNYYADSPDPNVGLLRAASLIAALRKEARNCLLFDNGDTLQGAPLGDAMRAQPVTDGRPHPMIAAMNALRYDAVTLGNHDFDYGLEFLSRTLQQADFPVVLSNAAARDASLPFLRQALLTRSLKDTTGARHVIRIGVIGVAPPQLMQWNRHILGDAMVMEDMRHAVGRERDDLLSQGADLIVVLAHSGYGDPHLVPASKAENAAAAIAAMPNVHAVVAGHTHAVRASGPETDRSAPLVQPGAFGSHIGLIDLELTRHTPVAPVVAGAYPTPPPPPTTAETSAVWSVRTARVEARPVAQASASMQRTLRRSLQKRPNLRADMAAGHRLTRAFAGQPLGQTKVALTSYVSMIAPCAAMTLIADAQRAVARRLVANMPSQAALPILSAVSPFRAGGRAGPANYTDIPPGPLYLRHAADLYIYPNTLALVRATGAQIRAWLERSASAFLTIHDPADQATSTRAAPPQPLLDPDFASYNFDCLDGLSYTIDVSRPAMTSACGETVRDGPGRIRDLQFANGAPLHPETEILVVTSSYRAAGGGHFPSAAAADTIACTTEPVRDLVAQHIAAAQGPIAPKARRVWRFKPLSGTPVVLELGPGAQAHRALLKTHGLTDLGEVDRGFHSYLWHI